MSSVLCYVCSCKLKMRSEASSKISLRIPPENVGAVLTDDIHINTTTDKIRQPRVDNTC